MKTFEFKINAGAGNEFTFYFDAQNLHTAEAIAKTRTKRGRKFEYVATHPVETLQQIQNEDHSAKISAQPRAFMFVCENNPDHVWMTDSDSSHAFKERCSKCRNADPITYKFAIDYNSYSTGSDNHA